MDSKNFDEDIKEWMEIIKTPRYKYAIKYLINILKYMNFKKKRILEIGCGISPYFSVLSENEVYGLDSSRELLKKNKGKVKLIEGDALNIDELFKKQKKFEVVLLAGLIHHIQDFKHEELFKKINNILDNEGILIFSEPTMVSITGLYYYLRKLIQSFLPKKFYLNLFGFSEEDEKYLYPQKIKKLLKKTNFNILEFYTIQLIRLPPFKILKRINVENINSFLDRFKFPFGTNLICIAKKK